MTNVSGSGNSSGSRLAASQKSSNYVAGLEMAFADVGVAPHATGVERNRSDPPQQLLERSGNERSVGSELIADVGAGGEEVQDQRAAVGGGIQPGQDEQ